MLLKYIFKDANKSATFKKVLSKCGKNNDACREKLLNRERITTREPVTDF